VTAPHLTATTVWRIAPELVLALDDRLGPPLDGYVNGTQTWLTDDDVTLEWRLHPAAGFRAPAGVAPDDLWDTVIGALTAGAAVDALPLGREERSLASLWDGLECFAPFGDDLEPQVLAAQATARLGRAPDAAGLVDHERVGREWERAQGGVSLVAMLFDELAAVER
jgi:hypothetical protein